MNCLNESFLRQVEEERIRDPKFVHDENQLVVDNEQLKQENKKLKKQIKYLKQIIQIQTEV